MGKGTAGGCGELEERQETLRGDASLSLSMTVEWSFCSSMSF